MTISPLREGFTIYARGMPSFALYWLPASVVVALNGFAAVALVGNDDLFARWPGDPPGFYLGFLAILGPSLVDAVFVVAFFGGAATMVREAVEGRSIRAWTGYGTLAARGRELFECGIAIAVVLGAAIALPLLPAIGAVYLNATMGLIFVWAGLAAGVALTFLTFKRFMFAPALLALADTTPPHALRESGRIARRTRNGIFAVELTLLLAGIAALSGIPAAVGSIAETRASMVGLAASVVAGALLWPVIPVAVARYQRADVRDELAMPPSVVQRPTLAAEERDTACPRCGTTVSFLAGVQGGTARCTACGLTGRVL